MTPSRWLMVCAVTGLVCFAWGRQSSTGSTVAEQERSSETVAVREDVSAAVEREATASAQEAQERIVYRERVVYRDGPVQEVSREVEGESSRLELQQQAREVEVRVETVEVEVVREVERLVEVKAPLPDWIAGPMVGLRTDGRITYGAMGMYRVLGPLHLGGYIQTPGLDELQVGLSVGVAF